MPAVASPGRRLPATAPVRRPPVPCWTVSREEARVDFEPSTALYTIRGNSRPETLGVRTRRIGFSPPSAAWYTTLVAVHEDGPLGPDTLPVLSGRACVLADEVGLEDVIQPGNGGGKDPASGDASARLPAATAHRFAPGDVLVATRRCADTAAGDAIAQSLRACGVAAVVGRAFTAGFCDRALASGLPALVIEEVGAIRPGDLLRVNIEAHIVANLSSGDRYVIRNIDEHELTRLRRATAA